MNGARRALLGAALTTLFAIAACDDNSKTTAPAPSASSPKPSASAAASAAPSASAPPPAAVTPSAFCAHVFGTVYDDFQKACSDDDKKSSDYQLAAAFAQMPMQECHYIVERGVERSRVTFDAGVAAKCMDAADKHKVAQKGVHLAMPDLDELAECKDIVTGNQALDQPCRNSLECKDPLTCIGAHQQVDGACKPVGTKAGDPCDGAIFKMHDLGHRAKCGPGLSCDTPDDQNKTAICQKAVAAGGACEDSDQCAEGLACHASKCDANGPAAEGGACSDDADDCKDGLFCKKDKGKKVGKCATKKAAGEACADIFECRGECRKAAGKTDGKCASICGSG